VEQAKEKRIERKKEENRKKIISTAIRLFSSQGFDQTTVEQIAEEADVARGTIFNHFPVKEAIILGYVQRGLNEVGPEIVKKVEKLPDTRSRLTALFRLANEWIERSLNEDVIKRYMSYMIQTLLDTDRNQGLRSGYGEILKRIIGTGQVQGEIRRDIPAGTLAIYLDWQNALVMMTGLAYPEMSQFDMIDRMTDLFLNGASDRLDKTVGNELTYK
jgi:AcrR family transcriptional regulator